VSYRLAPGRSLKSRSRRLVRAQIDGALRATRSHGPRDVESIHDVRTQMKKARAVIRLLRASMTRRRRRRADARLAEVAGRLGPIRDALVRRETLRKIERNAERLDLDREIARELAVAGGRPRAPSQREIEASLHAARRALEGIRRLPARLEIRHRGWAAMREGLIHDYRRARRRWWAARRDSSDENLHEFRKAVKTHWYHVRLLERAAPALLARREAALDRLADQLGEDRDLALLRESLASRSHAPPRRLLALVDRRRAKLQRDLMREASGLLTEPPGRFLRRVHRAVRDSRHSGSS
jgi:CHAD domain-containing protein